MSLESCANLLFRGDRDKFIAVTLTPVKIRRILFPIFAFNLEMSRIPWVASDPVLAEIRFTWWENELCEIFNNANGHKHEILDALSDVVSCRNLSLDLFLSIIEARRFDIYSDPHDCLETQITYIKKIFSSLLELVYRGVVKEIDDDSIEVVRKLGFALGVANLMRAASILISRGKLPFYRPEKVSTKKFEIISNSHFLLEAIEILSRLGLESLMHARQGNRCLESSARLAMLCSCSSFSILEKANRAPEKVLEGRCNISSIRRLFDLLCGRIFGKI